MGGWGGLWSELSWGEVRVVISRGQSVVMALEAWSLSIEAVQLIRTLPCVSLITARRTTSRPTVRLKALTSDAVTCQLRDTLSSREEHWNSAKQRPPLEECPTAVTAGFWSRSADLNRRKTSCKFRPLNHLYINKYSSKCFVKPLYIHLHLCSIYLYSTNAYMCIYIYIY